MSIACFRGSRHILDQGDARRWARRKCLARSSYTRRQNAALLTSGGCAGERMEQLLTELKFSF